MTIDRRSFLTAGGAVSLAALIAACGSDDDDGGAASTTAGSPTTGSSSAGASTTAAPSTSAAPSGNVPVMDEATMAQLDEIFATQFAATGLVGLAGAVRIGDGVWTGSTGVVDLETGEPFRADDFVRIASISKTYTATAVLQLVDEGAVALDDLLETYVPGVVNGDVATLADLLGMTSGIPDFTANDAFVERFTADPTLAWSDEDTLAVIAEASGPDFAPGEKVVYCDSNYALLGMVMKEVTGQPAGEVITTKIIEPLGLTSTSYPTDVKIPEPHPTSYVPAGGEPFDNEANPPRIVDELNPAVPSTAGAMISKLADLQVWGTELAEGSLLTPETQARRLEIRRFDGQQINFGYGLGITGLNEFLGHDGAIFGYSSVVFTRPQTDTQIAFIANESTNSTTPTLTVALGVIQALYPDQLS
jgi:D-alanyl-D-alanine carboxypeptidase